MCVCVCDREAKSVRHFVNLSLSPSVAHAQTHKHIQRTTHILFVVKLVGLLLALATFIHQNISNIYCRSFIDQVRVCITYFGSFIYVYQKITEKIVITRSLDSLE